MPKHILTLNEFVNSHYDESINENILIDKIKELYNKFVNIIPKKDESEIESFIEKMTEEEKIKFIKDNLKELEEVSISKDIATILDKVKSGYILTRSAILIAILVVMQGCATNSWTHKCHIYWKIKSQEYNNKYPKRSTHR